jgi:hypothetical protein
VDVKQRGGVRIPVAGTQRYVSRTVAEFEAYRAGLGAQSLTAS